MTAPIAGGSLEGTMTTISNTPSPVDQAEHQSDVSGSARTPDSIAALLVVASVGAAVAVALGVYAKVHTPTFQGIVAFGFPAVLPMKAWFTTVAATLALAQAGSAMWMYGRLPGVGPAPSWLATSHRWTGTVAFLFTLPVAYHCLWALGFKDTDSRVLAHSLLGCAFYGAFTTKMLALRSRRVPPSTLPIAGGLLFTILIAIWFTSSLWFFRTTGFPGV